MTIVFFANTDWYLLNFRAPLMRSAKAAGFTVACVSPPGPFGARLNEVGLDWQALPFERDSRLGMLRSLLRVRRVLRRRLRDERPDIVHSFTLTSILLTWLALPRGRGVRRINAVTGLGYAFTGHSVQHRLIRLLLQPLLRRALGRSDAWTVVQNGTDRQFLIESFGLDPARVRLIAGSGVDVQRFRPAHDRAVGESITVGFVGRLLTDKGIAEFIEAAARVKAKRPALRFVAAGAPDAGNPAAVDAATLARWQAAGDVEFVGQVDDMPDFLAGLDVFVLPSYREGLSRSLIEAGACGLPAVTTDVPGCRDVVRDGENGLLVPARDTGALADAIARLVLDAALRERMGERARAVVVEGFSNEVVNSATLGRYEEVVAG